MQSGPSLSDRLQGTWEVQSVFCIQNGSYVDALAEYQGTTLVFNKDSLTWYNPTQLQKGTGVFQLDSETFETNCIEDEDGLTECDTETIYSFLSHIPLLAPISQSFVNPIYVEVNPSQIYSINARELKCSESELKWKMKRNNIWYELTFRR